MCAARLLTPAALLLIKINTWWKSPGGGRREIYPAPREVEAAGQKKKQEVTFNPNGAESRETPGGSWKARALGLSCWGLGWRSGLKGAGPGEVFSSLFFPVAPIPILALEQAVFCLDEADVRLNCLQKNVPGYLFF